eukprot:124645_1
MSSSAADPFSISKRCLLLAWPWISGCSLAIIGYRIRNLSLFTRWVTAYTLSTCCQHVLVISNNEWIKILPPLLSDTKNAHYWMQINTAFSFLIAAGGTGIFGGKEYYHKHGIDSYTKAIISSLSNGSVYFKKNKHARYKAMKRLLRIC